MRRGGVLLQTLARLCYLLYPLERLKNLGEKSLKISKNIFQNHRNGLQYMQKNRRRKTPAAGAPGNDKEAGRKLKKAGLTLNIITVQWSMPVSALTVQSRLEDPKMRDE